MEHAPDREPVGDDRKPYLERYIHGEMYRQRPDVMAVVPSHSGSVIPFGITRGKMRPLDHIASFLWSGVPGYDIPKSLPAKHPPIRAADLAKDIRPTLRPCA